MIKRLAVVGLVLMAGCVPGYVKSSELERKGQGPSACAKSCDDLGMRMTAMVLVGDQLPGCVCQPLVKQAPIPAPEPPPASESGAAASTTGFVVIAAAAAARQQQEQQRLQQQQLLQQKH